MNIEITVKGAASTLKFTHHEHFPSPDMYAGCLPRVGLHPVTYRRIP